MTGEDLFFYATINAESESRIWPELSAEEKMIWDTAARYAAAQSPLKHGQCCRCPVVDGPRHD
jgi:hypothetical protein